MGSSVSGYLDIIAFFSGIGIFVAGIGFAYAQFKTGANKAKDDLVNTYKEQLEIEKEKTKQLLIEKDTLVQSHQRQLNELNEKIGKLSGLYEGAELRNKQMTDILQGRDPSNMEFMKQQGEFMTVVLKQIEENSKTAPAATAYMAQSIKILGEIKNFMETLNNKSNKTQDFIHNIEDATDSQTGKPVMKT